jgi:hypothetical protein
MSASGKKKGDDTATGEQLVAVRVKTRTGQARFRAGRVWHHDRWSRVEVTKEQHAELLADSFLDVEPLRAWEKVDGPELTHEEQVLASKTELAALQKKYDAMHDVHEKLVDDHNALTDAFTELEEKYETAMEKAMKKPAEKPAPALESRSTKESIQPPAQQSSKPAKGE